MSKVVRCFIGCTRARFHRCGLIPHYIVLQNENVHGYYKNGGLKKMVGLFLLVVRVYTARPKCFVVVVDLPVYLVGFVALDFVNNLVHALPQASEGAGHPIFGVTLCLLVLARDAHACLRDKLLRLLVRVCLLEVVHVVGQRLGNASDAQKSSRWPPR